VEQGLFRQPQKSHKALLIFDNFRIQAAMPKCQIRHVEIAWIFSRKFIAPQKNMTICGLSKRRETCRNRNIKDQEAHMTRDDLNRELKTRAATWHPLAIFYGLIVATLFLAA